MDSEIEQLHNKIELARLEIEHLKLENERLRLLNENYILRTQSNSSLESVNTIDSLTNTIEIVNKTEKEDIEYTEILDYDFTHSKILSCTINNTNVEQLNYTRIVRNIWEMMPRQIIYDSSTFNSKDYHYNKHSYRWIYEIQLSMQIGNTKEIVNEIIHMCKLMNFEIDLVIQLSNEHKLAINVSKDKEVTHTIEYHQVLKADKALFSRKYYGGYGVW
jgi:hypothetical protein